MHFVADAGAGIVIGRALLIFATAHFVQCMVGTVAHPPTQHAAKCVSRRGNQNSRPK